MAVGRRFFVVARTVRLKLKAAGAEEAASTALLCLLGRLAQSAVGAFSGILQSLPGGGFWDIKADSRGAFASASALGWSSGVWPRFRAAALFKQLGSYQSGSH